MNIGLRVEKNFDLGKIKLDLSKELNMSADIIILDIENGINYGRDINGTKFKKLAPSTIRGKRLGGSKTPRIALSDKEIMKKVYVPSGKRATQSNQSVEIIPPKKRADIGVYHQTGNPVLPKREWFGISKTAESRAFKMIELMIEKEIRDA